MQFIPESQTHTLPRLPLTTGFHILPNTFPSPVDVHVSIQVFQQYTPVCDRISSYQISALFIYFLTISPTSATISHWYLITFNACFSVTFCYDMTSLYHLSFQQKYSKYVYKFCNVGTLNS
jgi:hypothetical protein